MIEIFIFVTFIVISHQAFFDESILPAKAKTSYLDICLKDPNLTTNITCESTTDEILIFDAFYGVSNHVENCFYKGGDCIQFVPSTYLMVYNQCNGKNNCQITVPIFTIADFQGRLSSYLHLTYTPSTCGVFNKISTLETSASLTTTKPNVDSPTIITSTTTSEIQNDLTTTSNLELSTILSTPSNITPFVSTTIFESDTSSSIDTLPTNTVGEYSKTETENDSTLPQNFDLSTILTSLNPMTPLVSTTIFEDETSSSLETQIAASTFTAEDYSKTSENVEMQTISSTNGYFTSTLETFTIIDTTISSDQTTQSTSIIQIISTSNTLSSTISTSTLTIEIIGGTSTPFTTKDNTKPTSEQLSNVNITFDTVFATIFQNGTLSTTFSSEFNSTSDESSTTNYSNTRTDSLNILEIILISVWSFFFSLYYNSNCFMVKTFVKNGVP